MGDIVPKHTIKNTSLNVLKTFKENIKDHLFLAKHKEFPWKSMGFYIKINGKLCSLMKEEIIIIAPLVASL